MDPFLHLVREASSDPNVLSIKITIYRLASKAKLAEYLCAAAENGKEVTALMELRARFDEQNNIQWAERMEEAGCTLLYGAESIKVHSKICLITRRERGKIQYITQVGTGNYNEKTAKLYTDLCLMTASPAIGEDGAALFRNMATSNLKGRMSACWSRPINCGTSASSHGPGDRQGGAGVHLPEAQLHHRPQAHRQAGPGLPGGGGGGDERAWHLLPAAGHPGLHRPHHRVLHRGPLSGAYPDLPLRPGEDADLFLSSADFMTRNTERRVEVACPILDPELRRRVFHITDVLISDNVKARQLGPDGLWHPRRKGAPPCSSQEVFQQEAVEEEARADPHSTPHTGRKEAPGAA